MRISHKPRWLRGIAFTLVGLLSVFSFVTPSREASAGPGHGPCWWVWERSSSSGFWYRHLRCDPPLLVRLEWVDPGCIVCGLMIDWRQRIEDPAWLTRINQGIDEGLVDLGQAAFTQNPADRTRLRAAAMNSFGLAAYGLAGTPLGINAVGVGNPQQETFTPRNLPWLGAAAQDVVDGITILQTSGNQAAAAAQFDEAYEEISDQQVISG